MVEQRQLAVRLLTGLAVFLAAGALLYRLLGLLPSIHIKPAAGAGHDDDDGSGSDGSSGGEVSVFSLRPEHVSQWAAALSEQYAREPAKVLGVFCYLYVFKQAFAIPGSFFLNLLAGAVFGLPLGFALTCVLTAAGASGAYLLSSLLARPVVLHYLPARLEQLRARLAVSSTSPGALLVALISLRVFPFTPNWFVNLASPVVGVPLPLFALSVFLGLMPYNFVCCQAGQVASTVKSVSDVFTLGVLLKLLLITVVLLTPTIYKRYSAARRPSRSPLPSTATSPGAVASSSGVDASARSAHASSARVPSTKSHAQ
eukprot:m.9772 g.9772  ORF g.9772 m.9772 type:complete len:314 (-) comp5044_c0_seq1:1379-2320(-)